MAKSVGATVHGCCLYVLEDKLPKLLKECTCLSWTFTGNTSMSEPIHLQLEFEKLVCYRVFCTFGHFVVCKN